MNDNCPFCGDDECTVVQHPRSTDFLVVCRECGARGPVGGTEEEAMKLWNERMSS